MLLFGNLVWGTSWRTKFSAGRESRSLCNSLCPKSLCTSVAFSENPTYYIFPFERTRPRALFFGRRRRAILRSTFEQFPQEYIAERALGTHARTRADARARGHAQPRAHHPPIKNRTITTRVVRKKTLQLIQSCFKPCTEEISYFPRCLETMNDSDRNFRNL